MAQFKGTFDVHRRKVLFSELRGWRQKEEILWRQRLKTPFMQYGDQNSAWFHQRASGRKKQNLIEELRDANGCLVSDQEGLGNVVVHYFQQLFASSNPYHLDQVLLAVKPRVTEAINEFLYKPYTADKVVQALGQMHPGKSVGPNGLNPYFYQKY